MSEFTLCVVQIEMTQGRNDGKVTRSKGWEIKCGGLDVHAYSENTVM
jgi:hypothetical protein